MTTLRIATRGSALALIQARLVEAAVRLRIPAYLLVNNRAEGSAPMTVAEVLRMLPAAA